MPRATVCALIGRTALGDEPGHRPGEQQRQALAGAHRLAQRGAVAGQQRRPRDDHAGEAQGAHGGFHLALDAVVEGGRACARTERRDHGEALHAGGTRRVREGQHGVEVHRAKGRLRAGLLDRGAQAAIGIARRGQRGQRAEVHAVPSSRARRRRRAACAPAACRRGAGFAASSCLHQLAADQAGAAGQQHGAGGSARVHDRVSIVGALLRVRPDCIGCGDAGCRPLSAAAPSAAAAVAATR